ncbi:MAG: hypothetical protein R2838_23860 [Caldilineaceae bacterium]
MLLVFISLLTFLPNALCAIRRRAASWATRPSWTALPFIITLYFLDRGHRSAGARALSPQQR